MSYGVIPQLRASLQNAAGGAALTLFLTLYAREGADGQAVVCPLLRGSSPTRWVAPKQHRGHGLVEKDLSRGEAHNYSMEVRSDPFESAKSHFFDTSSWGEFCDVTLTLKQAWQPDRSGWVKIDDYRCRQA